MTLERDAATAFVDDVEEIWKEGCGGRERVGAK